MTTGTDPSTVPDWPAPVVRLTGQGTVEVDGVTVALPPDLDNAEARQWAVMNVAERYARLGRAIRVTAIEPDGTTFPLIVHLDGTVEALAIETTGGRRGWRRPRSADKPAAKSSNAQSGPSQRGDARNNAKGPAQPGNKSQVKGMIAAGGFLGLIALGAVVVLSGGGGSPSSAPHTEATTPSVRPTPPPPANLPRPAPRRLDDARRLGPQGQQPDHPRCRRGRHHRRRHRPRPARDPRPVRRAQMDRGRTERRLGQPGIHPHRRAARHRRHCRANPALLACGRPGPLPHQRRHPHLRHRDLPGSLPLISLQDSTAAVIADGKVQNVDLPVRATALAADKQTVLAADPSGHWWRLAPPAASRTRAWR
ncbi:hypothetical protein GCM10020000_35970 [Streptomyces olivoverticillatus]